MGKFVIYGEKPLKGNVSIGGSKNAVVAILPAALLAENPCTIDNVPDVSDVHIIIDILRKLGAICEWKNDSVTIDARPVNTYVATDNNIGALRGSYYFVGALLGRFGRAEVSLPGGCNLGARPIDQHLKGFKQLGADTTADYGKVVANAPDGLMGNKIFFDVVSVGATINVMIAACTAEGLTQIENCAKEPHVVDVANFLNAMGANIKGAGTDVIKIRGDRALKGGIGYTVIPDQIEAGTFMIAAAATGGEVTVCNIIPRHLDSLTAKLKEMNVGVETEEDNIKIYSKDDSRMCATKIKTMPYPGFPTDLQPQMTTLLSLVDGESTITEGVWESRFQYVDDLNRMGASINVNNKVAMISGNRKLRGATVRCPDLRAGAALVIAALASEGRSEVYDINYIDRGYADFEKKLRNLGADITRVDDRAE